MVSNFFPWFSCRATVFICMALLNAISLKKFQNKMKMSPTVLPVSLAEHLQIFKKNMFICNDERISDNNPCNECSIGRLERDCTEVL